MHSVPQRSGSEPGACSLLWGKRLPSSHPGYSVSPLREHSLGLPVPSEPSYPSSLESQVHMVRRAPGQPAVETDGPFSREHGGLHFLGNISNICRGFLASAAWAFTLYRPPAVAPGSKAHPPTMLCLFLSFPPSFTGADLVWHTEGT